MRRILFTVGYLLVSSNSWAAVPGSVETWDVDVADWEQSTIISTVVQSASGGNPDGHLQIRKDLGGAAIDIGTATTLSNDYLGDYAGVAGVGVDLNFGTDNVTNAWIRFRPDVIDNGWRYSLANVFPDNIWLSYSAPLDPNWDDATAILNGWERDDPGVPSFANLFASVGWAEVRIESPQTSTLVSVDNFELIAVPEPGSMLLVGASALAILCCRRRHWVC